MKVTAELSLYPLADDYEGPVIRFIKALQLNTDVSVHTHSMSTFVKGECKQVMEAIANAMEDVGESSASLVIKILNRDLPVEKGFLEF